MKATNKARVGLVGATGRMGRAVCALLEGHPELSLRAILTHKTPLPAHLAHHGTQDLSSLVADADIIIDFSAPARAQDVAAACAKARKPLLIASTQLTAPDMQVIREASGQTAVLIAANLSMGVAVMEQLVGLAAQKLPASDIEVMELHHRRKRDAPSGTAELLLTAIEKARGNCSGRVDRMDEPGPRAPETLGVQALRGGDVAGEHTVYFLCEGERLEITHRATGSDLFARGALRAALWLHTRVAGLYSMRDAIND